METGIRNVLAAALLLVAGIALFHRLGDLPFIGADEPRYARIAEEMEREGRWITPVLQGNPWLEKPPLYYWLTIPIFSMMGVSEWTARLPSALAALACSGIVGLLGRRIYGPRPGLYAAGILLTSVGFLAFGRSASTDMPLTTALTGSLAILCLAAVQPQTSGGLILVSYILLGLAVLAKGPVALALALGIGFLFWWIQPEGWSIRRWRLHWAPLAVMGIALPWFWLAFRENGFSFIAFFLINHNLARFVSEIHHHSEPFYFYIPVLLGLLFPWSGWLPFAVRGSWMERPCHPATIFLICWIAFPLVFFSVSSSKLPGYILPCLPPIALLLGKGLADWEADDHREEPAPFRTAFFFLFCIAVAAAVWVIFRGRYGGGAAGAIILALSIALPASAAAWSSWSGRRSMVVPFTLALGVLFVLALTEVAFPALGSMHSTRQISKETLELRQGQEPIVTYRFFHHTLHYYTGYRVARDLPDLESLREFLRVSPRALVITEAVRLDEIGRVAGHRARELARQGKLRLLRLSHD